MAKSRTSRGLHGTVLNYYARGKWFESLIDARAYAYPLTKMYTDVLLPPKDGYFSVIGRIVKRNGQMLWISNNAIGWVLNKDGTLGKNLGKTSLYKW